MKADLATRRPSLGKPATLACVHAPHAQVVHIHVAPARRLPMKSVAHARFEAGRGIVGDRYHGSRHRHVSVQSLEELAAAAERHRAPIDPGLTRRNVTLSAGTLPRRPGDRLRLGEIELEVVRDAAPCKLLDDALGRGARLALSRRAGVVCRVLCDGELSVGAPAWLGDGRGATHDD
jgi:MOSC domain-containing protein YiiM